MFDFCHIVRHDRPSLDLCGVGRAARGGAYTNANHWGANLTNDQATFVDLTEENAPQAAPLSDTARERPGLLAYVRKYLGFLWTLWGTVLHVLIACFIVTIGINMFHSLTERSILIRPISVPKNLADNGFTPEVASQHLRDGLIKFIREAHTERLHILLDGDQPDIIVPTVGLSVETISSWIRAFLGIGRRHEISGEITITTGKLWLRLRLKDKEFYTSSTGVDVERPDDLFAEAVPDIFQYTDPLLVVGGQLTAGNWQQALEGAQLLVEESSKPDEEVLSAYVVEGAAFMQMREYDNAIGVLKRAAGLGFEANATLHNMLGLVLLKQGKLDEAASEFNQAIALHPDFVYHYNLGLLLQLQNKLDEAAAECRRAIALDPREPGGHMCMAGVLWKQGKIADATVAIRRAVRLDPKSADLHTNLGAVLSTQGKLDDAIVEYHQAIALDPRYAPAHFNLGNALEKQRKSDDAIGEYREAIKLDPKGISRYINLGIALKHQGKFDEAIAELRQAIALDQNSANAHDNLGAILDGQGKLDDSITELRRAIELDPKSAHAHDNLGTALLRQGKLDDGMAASRRAIALDPKFAHPHDILGVALAQQGKLDDAISEFREAIELDPKFASPHYHLETILKAEGRTFEAIDEHNKGIALGSDDDGGAQTGGVHWGLE
jgi:tetratricopeptide (TPR) repeat protein